MLDARVFHFAFNSLSSETQRVRTEFLEAIRKNQNVFDVQLSDDAVERLADYHALVLEHNPILHLVAPCSPGEFATRHILESLIMLRFLPNGARLADIGTGAGLPSIPCLLARDNLSAALIESKEKKTVFLETAVRTLGLDERVEIVNRQFSEVEIPTDVTHVCCRALDKFEQKLSTLIRWSRAGDMLLFGGHSLAGALKKENLKFDEVLMPMSERRFLFAVRRR